MRSITAKLLLLSVLGMASGFTGAVDHRLASPGFVQSMHVTTDCFYFTLKNVSQADPVVAGPWFSMSRSHAGAKDAYATLLLARAADLKVWVSTDGQVTCGYARATHITLED